MTDPHSDKVLDSFLEEMLTNQHPPDLSAQIRQRWREELAERSSQPVHIAHRPSRATPATDLSHWRTAAIAAFATAAGLLLALGAWRFLPNDRNQNTVDPSAVATLDSADRGDARADAADDRNLEQTLPRNQLLSGGETPLRADTPSQSVGSTGSTTTTAPRPREEIALDKLPFNSDGSASAVASNSKVLTTQPVTPWSDAEVVAWVDTRFRDLWSKQQVEPLPPLEGEELASRVAWVLTGEDRALANAAPQDVAGKLLQSASFAEHWADRAVTYWLRGTPGADKKDKDGAALRTSLAQQIVARKPWNEIVSDWIGSDTDKPEAAFLKVLAGGNNHRLASRVGSVVLDEALACARCHDASENGRVISIDQDEYWSLVAIFTGIEVQAPKGPSSRTLVDRQKQLFANGKSPNVFFDRPDGRLQAANFRLPEGDNWRALDSVQTPRQGLARWIATTPISDEAAVNLAWRLAFGRPLVAQHAALDGQGLVERRQVLSTLAAQFRAHDRDMAQLVGWIVASQPFAAQPLNIDRQAWLLASEEEIARWNASTANFATFARGTASTQRLASLDKALVSVVRWSGTRDERRATLAQPASAPRDSKAKSGKPGPAASIDEPAPTYLIRSLQPTPAQSELINRLVASRLTWPQQVEHIAGLIGEAGNDGKLQRTADQLLKSKNGDRAAALFQLLQGALLCEESI